MNIPKIFKVFFFAAVVATIFHLIAISGAAMRKTWLREIDRQIREIVSTPVE
jgi:hypothetical protein